MMNGYLRLHFVYLFNRYSVIVLIILILISNIGIIYNSGAFEDFTKLDLFALEASKYYFQDTVNLIKIVSTFFVIIISVYINSKTRFDLAKYCVQSKKERFFFIISGLVIVILLNLVIIIEMWTLYLFVGNYFTPYFININDVYDVFMKIFIENLSYLILSMLLQILMRSIFVIIIPMIIFWINEINSEYELIINNSLLKQLNQYIPNLIYYNKQYIFIYDNLKYLLIILFCSIVYIIILMIKDIN